VARVRAPHLRAAVLVFSFFGSRIITTKTQDPKMH
jgi:hypothetical protein